MTHLPLAFSFSSSLTQVGAIAAFAALAGIAVLSLLVFSQAREIKRLREWAGRAPERDADAELRVAAAAAAGSRITRVAPRLAAGRALTTWVEATAPPTGASPSSRSASDHVLISLDRAAMIPLSDG